MPYPLKPNVRACSHFQIVVSSGVEINFVANVKSDAYEFEEKLRSTSGIESGPILTVTDAGCVAESRRPVIRAETNEASFTGDEKPDGRVFSELPLGSEEPMGDTKT